MENLENHDMLRIDKDDDGDNSVKDSRMTMRSRVTMHLDMWIEICCILKLGLLLKFILAKIRGSIVLADELKGSYLRK